uniref:(northern house mosquito) hypothetical protein n=1 Tax=Culex pipiens TaxID=7175 RepID=A0A8D8D9L0_CULPI
MVVTLFFSPKPPKRSFAAVGGSGGFDNYIFANCCAFLRRVRARTESVAQVRSGGASGHGPLDEADVQLRIGDALVREAETGSGAAFGRRETIFTQCGALFGWRRRQVGHRDRTALFTFADAITHVHGGAGLWWWSLRLLRGLTRLGGLARDRDALVREAQTTAGAALAVGQTIFSISGTGLLRDARTAIILPKSIRRIDRDWNECGPNGRARWHRNAFVREAQAATRTALAVR